MTVSQRDKAWRQTWHNTAPWAEILRPADDVFEKAEAALRDPDRDKRDERCAALAGVPQQDSPELLSPMWISARELTATFSDTEIMTSPSSTPQSVTWTSNLANLRDFKTVRNTEICFQCTNRDLRTKLSVESVTIFVRKFKVKPYSKYSNVYYVDLQRLPDDATDGVIYDWFANQGTPPVFITPAHTVRGFCSRSRRVFFNQKLPPSSVMLTTRIPLRQIHFTGQGYAVVHHRNRVFNNVVPLFIKELRGKRRQPTPAPL